MGHRGLTDVVMVKRKLSYWATKLYSGGNLTKTYNKEVLERLGVVLTPKGGLPDEMRFVNSESEGLPQLTFNDMSGIFYILGVGALAIMSMKLLWDLHLGLWMRWSESLEQFLDNPDHKMSKAAQEEARAKGFAWPRKDEILQRWESERAFRDRMYLPVLHYLLREKVLCSEEGLLRSEGVEGGIQVTPAKWRDGHAILANDIPGLRSNSRSIFDRLFTKDGGKAATKRENTRYAHIKILQRQYLHIVLSHIYTGHRVKSMWEPSEEDGLRGRLIDATRLARSITSRSMSMSTGGMGAAAARGDE